MTRGPACDLLMHAVAHAIGPDPCVVVDPPLVDVTPAVVAWSAEQVLRMHDARGYPVDAVEDPVRGWCRQCRPDGCTLRDWAAGVAGHAVGRVAVASDRRTVHTRSSDGGRLHAAGTVRP